MNEVFLSFIWKYRLYSPELTTTNGLPVTVLMPGEPHTNAGPDFFNARLRIGDTLWAGNVEIHVRASDWYRHRHQADRAYDNVVLHVVFDADSEIIMGDMTTVPTVALRDQVDREVLRVYAGLRTSRDAIPCSNHLRDIDPFVLASWIDRMLVERLEHKSVQIEQALQVNKGDWEDAFYQLLARNFGFSVNAQPFEMLARVLPRNLLLRHRGQPHQVEALVFGQAGLLSDAYRDAYPVLLRKEYDFLSAKLGLIPLDAHIWKQLRMRPANFPQVRLSQFASLVTAPEFGFMRFLNVHDPAEGLTILQAAASPYWSNHYMFDKPARHRPCQLGTDSARNIIINTIAPCLFYYGKSRGEQTHAEKVFRWLRSLQSESNHILDSWKRWGIESGDAFTGQALLGLYKGYCSEKKCLNCSLGMHLLKHHHAYSG